MHITQIGVASWILLAYIFRNIANLVFRGERGMKHPANTTSATSVIHHQSHEEVDQPEGGGQSAVVLLIVSYFAVAAIAIGSLLALTAA